MDIKVLVHRKGGSSMARISMDFVLDPGDSNIKRGLQHPMIREATTEACADVLRRIGKLGEAVDAFRVTFSKNKDTNWEAGIIVHFSNPMGTKCSHSTSYEFKDSEWPYDFRLIAMRICRNDFLEHAIRDHIERGLTQHKQAAERFKAL